MAALSTSLALALAAGCGGGARQDEDEREASYRVEVVTSDFPARQKLAQTTNLSLGIKNVDDQPIPNLAITVFVDDKADGSFKVRDEQEDLADPNRPVWILEPDFPKLVGVSAPSGAVTAYSNTWAFGRLEPGKTLEAIWRVTAVRGGTHSVNYKVAAGLDGKAKAVGEDGDPPKGKFVVTISTKAPNSRVTDSGRVVRE